MRTEKTGGAVPAPPDPPSIPDARLHRLLLILFALAVGLPGLTSLPAGDRDESRFAQATKQMTETGDYLRIMNGAEPRNKKPIGIYWLQAPAVLAAGQHLQNPIWPYRIPSVLGGLAATLAVFEIGLLFTGLPALGALAAAMLAGSLILAVETHIAKTDAALLGATTIAMAILARAWFAAPIGRWQAAAFWLAAAAGILLKGPITPMVLGLTAGTLCLWERRARWLLTLRPLWGVPLMLAAILPWFIAIGLATHGAFFAQAVGGDLGRKLAGGTEAHGGLPGLHLLLLPLLAFPSTIPVLAGLPAAWADRHNRATRFLLAWIIPSWLVFEAVPTKLPHYTLPLYPALFLLAARFLLIPQTPPARWIRIAGRIAVLAAAITIGGAAVALPIFLHAGWWLGLPACLACALVTWLSWRRHAVLALAVTPLLYAAILYGELPRIPALWIAPRIEAVLRADWPGWNALGKGVVVAGIAEPSLMFALGTDIALVANGSQGADALARTRDGVAIVADQDKPDFDRQATRLGVLPHTIGEIRGFNYSRGRWITLGIYATK
jgi:4-amino-4-deoxy-L-arabinose transferase-like glycosyltransferase